MSQKCNDRGSVDICHFFKQIQFSFEKYVL